MSTIADRTGRNCAEAAVSDIAPERDAARSPRRGRLAWAGLFICLALVAAWYVVARERPALSSGAAATSAPVFPPVPVMESAPFIVEIVGAPPALNIYTPTLLVPLPDPPPMPLMVMVPVLPAPLVSIVAAPCISIP